MHGSLQPKFLLRAAVQAGAAGEAGEMEKDERHKLDVLSDKLDVLSDFSTDL